MADSTSFAFLEHAEHLRTTKISLGHPDEIRATKFSLGSLGRRIAADEHGYGEKKEGWVECNETQRSMAQAQSNLQNFQNLFTIHVLTHNDSVLSKPPACAESRF